MGNISCHIYVVHFLIVALFGEYFEEYSLFILVLAVFLASLIIYYLIEAPLHHWRQRRVAVSRVS